MTSVEKRELIQQGAHEGMSVAEMARVYRGRVEIACPPFQETLKVV
jgi:hypothetical protein